MYKANFFFVFLLVPLFLVTPGHADDLEETFLGIEWGAAPTEIEGLSELYKKGKVGYFVRPDVHYTVKEISSPNVIYGFYSKKFFAAYISLKSLDAYFEISQYLRTKYGIPSMTMKTDQKILRWKQGKVKIKLKVWEKAGIVKLAFYYTPLSTELNEGQQEKDFEKSMQFLPLSKEKKPKGIPLLVF